MQRRVALFGASAIAAVLVGSASAMPPLDPYVWAQPGTAYVATPEAQEPAWVAAEVEAFVLAAPAYHWAQPWGWSPATAHVQPLV